MFSFNVFRVLLVLVLTLAAHVPGGIAQGEVGGDPPSVNLKFGGLEFSSGSTFFLDDIGEEEEALMYLTDRDPCCGTHPYRFGEWYYPNETKVPTSGTGWSFYRNRRDDRTVRLNRRNNTVTLSPTGVYRCEVLDQQSILQTAYASLTTSVINPTSTAAASVPTATTVSPTPLSTTEPPPSVSLSLRGVTYPNNSVFFVDEIGLYVEGGANNALICHTELQPCCKSSSNRFGEWHYPNGSIIPNSIQLHNFYRNRGDDGIVRLNHFRNSRSPIGHFMCSLPDADRNNQTIHVFLTARLIFHGLAYPNNSVFLLEEIGEESDNSALTCGTKLRPCCSTEPDIQGEWFYPNGVSVPDLSMPNSFYSSRGDDGTVHLNRVGNPLSPLGVYQCGVPDEDFVTEFVYAEIETLISQPTEAPTTVPPTTEETTAAPTSEEMTIPPSTEEMTAAPTTEETTAAPTTEETTAAPSTEETTIPPTTEEMTAAPTTEEMTAAPTTEETTAALTTEEATAAPTTEETTIEPMTEETTAEPTTEETSEETTEETTTESMTEETTAAPTTEEMTAQSTTQEATTLSTTEETTVEPTTEETTVESMTTTESTTEETITESTTEETTAESTTEETTAESTTEEITAEATTEETTAESTTEETTAEATTEETTASTTEETTVEPTAEETTAESTTEETTAESTTEESTTEEMTTESTTEETTQSAESMTEETTAEPTTEETTAEATTEETTAESTTEESTTEEMTTESTTEETTQSAESTTEETTAEPTTEETTAEATTEETTASTTEETTVEPTTEETTAESTTDGMTTGSTAEETTTESTTEETTVESKTTAESTAKEMSPPTIGGPTVFQLRLNGIINCEDWVVIDAESKVEELKTAIVEAVTETCDCDIDDDFISSGTFSCFPDSDNSVTYRAELHMTDVANTSFLLAVIQNFVEQKASLALSDSVVSVDNTCRVGIGSFDVCECVCVNELMSTSQTTTEEVNSIVLPAILPPVLLVLLVLALMVVIIVIFVVRRRRRGILWFGRAQREEQGIVLQEAHEIKDDDSFVLYLNRPVRVENEYVTFGNQEADIDDRDLINAEEHYDSSTFKQPLKPSETEESKDAQPVDTIDIPLVSNEGGINGGAQAMVTKPLIPADHMSGTEL